ncbi:MAG: hypothetical protein QXK88_06850 [Desulfurococcaceae archaeon]
MIVFFFIQSFIFIGLALNVFEASALFGAAALAGFFYGSALALYPALTGDFFGLKHLSTNYSLVFTGWGIAGLVSPSLGGYFVDLTGGYELALIIFGVFSLAGSSTCLYLLKRLKLYLE